MNLDEIKRTLDVFMPLPEEKEEKENVAALLDEPAQVNHSLIEIRTVGKNIMSGYFRSHDKILAAVRRYPNETFYFVLNAISNACYSREQSEKFITKPKAATSDGDITNREWLLIDCDPKRVSGVSASDEEKALARAKTHKVGTWLRHRGFSLPVIADSGNGYHLLFKIDLKNTTANTEIIRKCLQAVDMLFSDEQVSVDTSVFNASRITKLYGTMATKGTNTTERPHRLSKIEWIPENIRATSLEAINSVIAFLPEPPKPTPHNGNIFDLREFMRKHGITVASETPYNGGTRFILDRCLFDENHKGKDAAIIQLSNGAIAYSCFHNSCAAYRWQDVRIMFEPNAYDKKTHQTEYRKPNHTEPTYKPPIIQQKQDSNGQPIFFTTEHIRKMKTPPEEFIKTGITVIDKKMRGLKKGAVSCVTGLRASGKSSWISQLAIEAANQNYRTALFSGELIAKTLYKWTVLQAAGDYHTQMTQFENYYTVSSQTEEAVSKWLDGKLYIYNNAYGNNFREVYDKLNACVKEHKVDMIILDNLMALDITMLDHDKYEQQSRFVQTLCDYAKAANIHIVFVAHPRKAIGFLRLDDVGGSGNITNRVDNAFVVHRSNADFKRLSQLMYGKQKNKELDFSDTSTLFSCDNIIEVCKDRDSGIQDVFIPLYFESSCKRLKNEKGETKIYGWDNTPLHEMYPETEGRKWWD